MSEQVTEYYFVFGQEAAEAFSEGGVENLINAIEEKNIGWEVYTYKQTDNPCDLLYAYQGYESYISLSAEEQKHLEREGYWI